MRRDGNQVYFRSVDNGSTKSCWLTTWMDWCYGADVGDGDQTPNDGYEMAKAMGEEMVGDMSEDFTDGEQQPRTRRRRGDAK